MGRLSGLIEECDFTLIAVVIDKARHKGRLQRRLRVEETAAKRLEAELETLRKVREAARETETQMRNQLGVQGIQLAHAGSEGAAAREQAAALQGRIDEEKAAHDATRQLLTEALARRRKTGESSAARRPKRPRT